jgi:biopolymer transport protein ExbD
MPLRVQCPQCGEQLLAGDDRIGKNSTCPKCRTKFPVRPANEPAEIANELEDTEDEEGESGGIVLPAGDDGKYEDLVDMTAMVDIVFFLLVFFMITTASGVLSCIEMPKPKQDGAPSSAKRASDFDQDSDCVTVRIDEQNRIFIDDVEYPTEADLHNRLLVSRNASAKKLLVKAHGNAHNGVYVMVQDLGREVGFEEFLLSVAKDEEPQ